MNYIETGLVYYLYSLLLHNYERTEIIVYFIINETANLIILFVLILMKTRPVVITECFFALNVIEAELYN